MNDFEITSILTEYTREAANAKEALGVAIKARVANEPHAVMEKPQKRFVLRFTVAVAAFVLLLTVSMQSVTVQAFATFIYENVIQRIFQQKEINQNIEGIYELETLFPHGEIVWADGSGLASYVIYIDETYNVEQSENLLLITPKYEGSVLDLPPVFMEITQVTNTTIEDIVAQYSADGVFTQTGTASDDFPYVVLYHQDGQQYNSKCNVIYIRDNECGGVFVITAQYFFEAAEGHGTRFGYALGTLEIIDVSQYDINAE